MPYRLTPRMLQHYRTDLTRYHDLFNGGRCQGWELEELIVRAIKSDTVTQHHARWTERGHDDRADIEVQFNGRSIFLQIKSGQVNTRKRVLEISGHRHTRYNGDLDGITNYLNYRNVNFISTSYDQRNDNQGRHHIYQVRYIDIEHLTGILPDRWEANQSGTQYLQENDYGVLFKLIPKMSWQIWWEVPLHLMEIEAEFEI